MPAYSQRLSSSNKAWHGFVPSLSPASSSAAMSSVYYFNLFDDMMTNQKFSGNAEEDLYLAVHAPLPAFHGTKAHCSEDVKIRSGSNDTNEQ